MDKFGVLECHAERIAWSDLARCRKIPNKPHIVRIADMELVKEGLQVLHQQNIIL
jgi:hypothetical protein